MEQLKRYDAPTSLEIYRAADDFDFDHAVTNKRLPWRTPSEVLRSWRFEKWQRSLGDN
jgi:hypothetical protein